MNEFKSEIRWTLTEPFRLVQYYFCPVCGFAVSNREIEESRRDGVRRCTSCRRACSTPREMNLPPPRK